MKGLLYKDWTMIFGGYKTNFLFLLLFYGGFTALCRISFLSYALVFVLGMYASSTISMDESSHWDAYARTLPVSPRQLVSAKYLLTLLLTAVSIPLGLLLILLIPDPKPSVMETASGMISAAAVTLMYISFVMPLSYRFGAAKARSWVSITIFIVFFGPVAFFALMKDAESNPATQLLHTLKQMMEASSLSDQQWILLFLSAVLGAALVCLLISWAVSVRIYAKKNY
ncbi:ABC-2 transporter permease [Subdoligranulum variabile]|uniref:ABC-2 type transporter n=1 Tax=Subdoligranulum variabile DSM 15176 TaxID=411471 RepID=D1PJT0_9FIRM|nr:ABC-2 transporter permease [Subdoligranulum variabile]EFB77028.1 hypothetical protein SUBVAR_04650 [Subdoligranulum variabile DSM 15176]UWP67691.1 ABC-2 transporter permease [Subdoligranulum variabile]